MKNPIGAGAQVFDGRGVGDIGFDDRHTGVFEVLFQIDPAANRKIIDNPNLPTRRNQSIDEMAPDETRASRDDINFGQTP
jgi:hypothetical protein